jgi:hypothetical protein
VTLASDREHLWKLFSLSLFFFFCIHQQIKGKQSVRASKLGAHGHSMWSALWLSVSKSLSAHATCTASTICINHYRLTGLMRFNFKGLTGDNKLKWREGKGYCMQFLTDAAWNNRLLY